MKHFLVVLMALVCFGMAEAQVARFSTEFTRPDTNLTYTAGDAVAGTDSLPFALVPAGRYISGRIVGAKLSFDTVNVANGTFRLFLFADSLNLGKHADNAAFSMTSAIDSLLIGYIDFTLAATGTASSTQALGYVAGSAVKLYFKLNYRGGAFQGLWGILTATGAYVPKISGVGRITLDVQEVRQ